MLQPTQYDAVRGGQQPNISTAAVLGGKNVIEKALEMLKHPKHYEQAKQILLAQPKVEHSALDIKFRSAKNAGNWFQSTIEFPKKLKLYNLLYEWDITRRNQMQAKTHLYFSTPSVERIVFQYELYPEFYYCLHNDYAYEHYHVNYPLHGFDREIVYTRPGDNTNKSVTIREVRLALKELPQAFNFAYFNFKEWNEKDTSSCTTPIANYWDSGRQKMILLP